MGSAFSCQYLSRLYPDMPRLARLSFISLCAATWLSACTLQSQIAPPDAAIGSTSLCADSYLIALAPERIGALSWQAGTPISTASRAMAQRPRLWASREVLSGTQMSVVTGPGDPSFEREDTLALTWGEDFAAVQANARAISARFNLDIAPFEAELDKLSALEKPAKAPRILYLSRSGGSAGSGTFVDAVIRAAGGINVNTALGWHTPAIERVLQFEPDLIVTSFFGSDYAGISDRAVRHSALRRYLAAHPRVEISGKLWPCAGPGLIEATQQLNTAVLAL